jgi:GntR family transcriptional regulator/MocR family aminotransferase
VKGIVCDYEQIIIIPGTSGGMDILAKTLERRSNRIAVEDPCIDFVKNIFSKAGYDICPVGVDSQGMDINELKKTGSVDLIYVVPSHQYPIGGVLPASGRIALLNYANEQSAYVIEDDYDSEFRYKGESLQALRNLCPDSVIYLGSFSKIFSPSLRLGYMILPKHLCGQVMKQMELSNTWVNTTEQLALAEFINQMLLDKHIYKMKKLYEKKRLHLMKCLTDAFGKGVKVTGEYAGLHLLASFDRELTENDLQRMKENGIEIDFVEDSALIKGKHRNQLVLGYGELSPDRIEEGIRRLKTSLDYLQ